MRKVTFGVANSLDNYIAREDHGLDWLNWSDEVGAFVAEFWKEIDAIVMGRKTYEAGRREMKGKNPYPGMKSYVLSRTMKASELEDAEVASDAVKLLRKLKRERGRGICVLGGGEIAVPLLEAGLIDEIGVNIHPVLLGSGVPLFHRMRRQIDLRLVQCRQFKNGCVLLTYAVAR